MIEYKNDFECANSNQYGKLYRCFVTSKLSLLSGLSSKHLFLLFASFTSFLSLEHSNDAFKKLFKEQFQCSFRQTAMIHLVTDKL